MTASLDVAELLARTIPFNVLPANVVSDIADGCERVFVRGGDVVLRENEPGDRAYVVISGRLRVYAGPPSPSAQIGELGSGQLFGEMALLSPGGRRFSIVAGRDSELLSIGREQFERLVVHPESLLALVRLLVQRATTKISPSGFAAPNTIAVVGAGGVTGVSETVEALTTALSAHGTAIRVDAAVVENSLGRGAADVGVDSAGDLLGWLDRIERDHRFVLYQTDPTRSAWTDRCLRGADRILLVVDADQDPLTITVPSLPDGPRCDILVRHHASAVLANGTAALLDRLPPVRHYQLRRGSERDVDRVARQLTGASVGLVLGGGGARGFAHLGVIRALEEAGVPIDSVGGTSVGAMIGALVAWGLDHPNRMEQAHRFVAGRLTWPTLPIMAATSGRRLTERLQRAEFVGESDLVDSWLPFFCISTNLSTARPYVHLRGPAWKALRASISLPGMMPPVCTDDGELLVDGGLVNDLPVDVMAPLIDGGRIIAVDLGLGSDFRVTQRFDPGLSGWKVLVRRLKPFGPRFDAPNLLAVLLRAKEVASSESLEVKRSAHDVTLLLRPPVEGYGGFDFRAVDALTERSYRYTLDVLARNGVAAELRTAGEPLRNEGAGSQKSG